MVWTSCNSGFSYPPYVLTFSVKGNNIYTGDYNGGGFYKSTNYGLNWSLILTNYYGSNKVLSSLVYNNAIIAGIYNYGGANILLTTNDGGNWTNVSAYYPPWIYTDLRSLASYNYNLLVGTYGKSIYSIPFNQIIGIKQISSTVPDKFYLHQNYPNPFKSNYKYQVSDSK